MTRPERVLRLAGVEERPSPVTAVDEAELAQRLADLVRLAVVFEDSAAVLQEAAAVAQEVLVHPDVSGTAPLSPRTWARAEDELRALTVGPQGLLGRSTDLEADAVVLRATAETYRWIDDLQSTAYRTFGRMADRAEGYVAPHVNLGGALVAAGLIETDALERDGVATYLTELAAEIPELMDHVTTGGGLLDGLQVRGLLTVGLLGSDSGRAAGAGGLRAAGIVALDAGWGAALRDVAIDLDTRADDTLAAHDPAAASTAPTGLADLFATLLDEPRTPVRLSLVAPGRLLVLVGADPGPVAPERRGRLRLVSGDPSSAATRVVDAVRSALSTGPDTSHVLLVGHGSGGTTALDAASRLAEEGIAVEHVVTAQAPPTLGPRNPAATAVLAVEDRNDPVALLGSLLTASDVHRLTVIYDAASAPDRAPLIAGGLAADRSSHPALVALLGRWRELGFLRAP